MKPKALEKENEAIQASIAIYSRLLPESPILARLRADIERNEEEINAIQSWLENIPDAFIKDVIRTFRCTGDWSKTNSKIYGYPSYHTCRKAVIRYLEKTDFLERFG